jgi:hypothetical protein
MNKKSIIKSFFLGVSMLLFVVFGYEIFIEYMANHTYYFNFLIRPDVWKIILS